MLAKVIDKRSPFYGLVCDVGHMTEEGLHRISEKDAPWHSGYAYASQLQPLSSEQPQPYQAQQRPPEQMVRVYKNSKAFLKDEKKFRKQGWLVANQTANQSGRSLGGKIFVPFGLFTKKSEIIVTYQRGS